MINKSVLENQLSAHLAHLYVSMSHLLSLLLFRCPLLSLLLAGAAGIGTLDVFQRSCQTPITGFLFCSFTVTKNWDFLKFREWSNSLPGKIKNVELYVKCENGASVFLPWPMRARSLQVVDIQGCLIRGFYDEYETPANHSDSIVDLKIAHCVIEENQQDHIHRSLHRRPSRSFACGQESIVVMDTQNLTWTFPRFPVGPRHQSHSTQSRYSCNYTHMIYLEETFQSLQEDGPIRRRYPVLKVATFSSNNLSCLPDRARHWSATAPLLEILDLSNNSIKQFQFDDPLDNHTLYVDLRNNSIADVPRNMTSYLKATRAVIIDLRHNPIRCSCDLLNFRDYLLQIRTRFPEWQNGTSVYCRMNERTLDLVTDLTSQTCEDY